MTKQRLYSYTRKAITDYNMIQENDCIGIGISGGKDSLVLLDALAGLQTFFPVPFQIKAFTVDLGYPDFKLDSIQSYCRSLGVEYHIVTTQIADIVKQHRTDKSICSLCARLRKGAINEAALSYGCNKIAYAHHRDDMIETMMMSLIYEGSFYAFPPVTKLDHSKLTIIRPMMYVPETDIYGYLHKNPLPIVKNPCPYDGHTKREEIKQLVRELNQKYPGVKKRLFTAIQQGNIPDWPSRKE